MTLIKSISGIRGTIGGHADEGLTPLDVVKLTSAYASLIRKTTTVQSNKIVVGRDARLSGEMVNKVVCGTLMGMGFDVVDIGLASTPTTELAVTMEGACGGIILTASHNPRQWNALKLLNERGEFLNAAEGQEVLRIAAAEEFVYADVETLGKYRLDETYNQKHIGSDPQREVQGRYRLCELCWWRCSSHAARAVGREERRETLLRAYR